MTNGTETFYRIDVPLGLSCRVSVHVCSMTVNSWEDFSFHGLRQHSLFRGMSTGFVVALYFRSVARWVRLPENRSNHQGWLRREERVCVISTTPVGMGPCCIVDRSEPSAQRRRRIQGRTPESAPLACSINIDLVRGIPFQLLASIPNTNRQSLQRVSQEGNL